MPEQHTLVSIVCPAYHEQEVLPSFHQELSRVLAPLEAHYQFEILLVDDGSRDGTLEAMKAVARSDPRVRVLSLARNFGKEAALQAGLEHAAGDLIITMDTDLQHPPELIPQLLEQAGAQVDLVITVRQEYQKPNWFNQMGTQAFYKILHSLSEIEIRQETSDFLLMKRHVRTLLLQMHEKHRFMKGLIHWMGFPYREVPFRPKQRTLGHTKFSFRHLLALGKDCLFSFSKKPLSLAINAGLVTLGLGALWSLAALVQVAMGLGETSWLLHYMLISSHLIGGAVLVAVGILGEYVGRIWEQVRSRPDYLLKYDSQLGDLTRPAYHPPHIKVFERATVTDKEIA